MGFSPPRVEAKPPEFNAFILRFKRSAILIRLLPVSELVFEVTQEADGGFCAECLSDTIATEGNTWEELGRNVREVVRAFYFDQPENLPKTIRIHLVRDEVLAVA